MTVREEVESIRESLAKTDEKWARFNACHQALEALDNSTEFEDIELWARLAADLAGTLQRQEAAK